VTREWDTASFSLVFRAQRDISAGEELTVVYCSISNGQVAAKRQKSLEPYGFRCKCKSCLHPEHSDPIRQQHYYKVLPLQMQELQRWLLNRTLPKDHLLKGKLETVRIMEEEGLYFALRPHYKVICFLYGCLADKKNTIEWGVKEARIGAADTVDGDEQRVKKAHELATYTKRPEWGLRKLPPTDPKFRSTGFAMLYAEIMQGFADGKSAFFTIF
jgi:hypothetical protein